MFEKLTFLRLRKQDSEKGQSTVLIALMFIGLLAFVGLAVDVGFIYARAAQLSTAMDAAALAGVTELTAPGRIGFANERAAEFMHTHNIPGSVITNTFTNGMFDEDITVLGAREYAVTATWPVELFFLRVIGRDTFRVTESATAAHFPLADIFASRRVETGALSTSNQAVFGQNGCVPQGDPFSSILDGQAATFRDIWRGDATDRTYHYRILIPPDYPDDVLRVELFDPDSVNQANNSIDGDSFEDTVLHTQLAQSEGMDELELLSCTADREDPCLIDTDERNLGYDLDQINMWWYARVDENRGSGTAPGDGSCGEPAYNEEYNTVTLYELFYYQRLDDGTIERTPLAFYHGQSGDFISSGERNGYLRDFSYSNFDHSTDLRWVSPGAQPSSDQTVLVPSSCGSPNGGDYVAGFCEAGTPAGEGTGFEINIVDDLSNILVDGLTANRYVYLDVTALSGSSENAFEVWAGPNDYVNSVASNVNVRNVQVVDDPSSHSSQGASVFGTGHLPMNSTVNFRIDIPLIYVGPEYAGTQVFISLFDSDSGADPPITFYFDTIAQSDWSMTFSQPGVDDPDGIPAGTRCIIGDCWTEWIEPPYAIQVPTLDDNCTDPSDPAQQNVCNPFYGGRLIASYQGGLNDTYHWNINLNGLPFLVR